MLYLIIIYEDICYYYSWVGAQLDFIHSWVMYASLYDKKKASNLYNKKKTSKQRQNKDI